MKILLLTVIGIILIALFVGLFFLMKGNGNKALYSLMIRVGLSVFLIVLLVVSFYMGWLTPHPVGG